MSDYLDTNNGVDRDSACVDALRQSLQQVLNSWRTRAENMRDVAPTRADYDSAKEFAGLVQAIRDAVTDKLVEFHDAPEEFARD